MSGRRWICTSTLLIVAGVLTAVATARHWAPCGTSADVCGELRDETHGFPGWGGRDLSDPDSAALIALAGVLLAVAWVVAVGWSRDSWTHRIMFLLIGVQPLVAAGLAAYEWLAGSLPAAVGGWLTWPAEAYIFPLLLGAGWLLNEPPRTVLRLMALGWAVTSFGSLHHFGDYVVARIVTADPTGDSPTGLGYATAALQVVIGLALLASYPRGERRDGGGRPRRGDHTLAAWAPSGLARAIRRCAPSPSRLHPPIRQRNGDGLARGELDSSRVRTKRDALPADPPGCLRNRDAGHPGAGTRG